MGGRLWSAAAPALMMGVHYAPPAFANSYLLLQRRDAVGPQLCQLLLSLSNEHGDAGGVAGGSGGGAAAGAINRTGHGLPCALHSSSTVQCAGQRPVWQGGCSALTARTCNRWRPPGAIPGVAVDLGLAIAGQCSRNSLC